MIRAIVLAVLLTSVLSCKRPDDDSADSGITYTTTFGYHLSTGETTLTGITFFLTSENDIKAFQDQTGVTQQAGKTLIIGRIINGGGTGIAAVTVQPHNDSGLSTGQLFYQSSTTFAYGPGVQTSSTGRFVVLNADPGRVNIKCSTAADGNMQVLCKSDCAVYMTITATPVKTSVAWSGVTANLGATGTALPASFEDLVTLQVMGVSGTQAASLGDGTFSFGSQNARNDFLVKCSKAAFVDTYTYVRTDTTALTPGAGGGDVLIVDSLIRDTELKPTDPLFTYTAGTGVIRGRVMSGSGGFTVEARDEAGTAQGVIRYGDNANFGKPSEVLTATMADGIFYIYNLPPGQYFLRASMTGAVVNTYVDVIADSWTIARDLTSTVQGVTTITLSGALATLLGSGVPKGNISLQGVAVGAQSDPFNAYTMTGVPTRQTFIVKTSK